MEMRRGQEEQNYCERRGEDREEKREKRKVRRDASTIAMLMMQMMIQLFIKGARWASICSYLKLSQVKEQEISLCAA